MKNQLHQIFLNQRNIPFSIRKPQSIIRKAFMLLLVVASFQSWAQTPVPMGSQPSLTYTENFDSISSWTNGFATGVGANRFASVLVNSTGTVPSATRITTSANFVTGSSGGVQRGTGNIQLLSTGATDNTSSAAIDFFMDFTGVTLVLLASTPATVFNTTGNRSASCVYMQLLITATWTQITGNQFTISCNQ